MTPTKRSVYTGSIVYLPFNEDLDIHIVIHTSLIKECKAYFHVGGGIIYDYD
ncbi:MAG: chorismate-binding protein [Chloroflexota bacterium]